MAALRLHQCVHECLIVASLVKETGSPNSSIQNVQNDASCSDSSGIGHAVE
jgi:hypothetical protein